ncbi:phosphopantetheine-binding protein [Streptomyces kronopolitis]|uniref:phosphopantetheine-binding protein n=1 Tax=Streptomyces kronopolitis TaxID=1612435 RepID=UPI0034394971
MSETAGPTGDALRETIRALVARQLPDEGGRELTPDLPLREAGLNSLGTVATLVAIEGEFGIGLPDELVTPETFHSVRTLTAAVAFVVDAERDTTGGAGAEDAVT